MTKHAISSKDLWMMLQEQSLISTFLSVTLIPYFHKNVLRDICLLPQLKFQMVGSKVFVFRISNNINLIFWKYWSSDVNKSNFKGMTRSLTLQQSEFCFLFLVQMFDPYMHLFNVHGLKMFRWTIIAVINHDYFCELGCHLGIDMYFIFLNVKLLQSKY